jgi:hypothetical protein
MNKRIVAISILMLMMCATAASVFADERTLEYEYLVEMRYIPSPGASARTKDYPVWASSQGEAMDLAERACKWDFGSGVRILNCGIPRPTGNSRPK